MLYGKLSENCNQQSYHLNDLSTQYKATAVGEHCTSLNAIGIISMSPCSQTCESHVWSVRRRQGTEE